MEKVIKRNQSLYCPISVSDMVTNNAKLRQNSLREYSHAKNAAHRAFCRAPGRPQTAAFGRVYFEAQLKRRSRSPSEANLRECVVASKATTLQERNDTTSANSCAVTPLCQTSLPDYTERRLLPRARTARTTLMHTPEKLHEIQAMNNGTGQRLEEIFVNSKVETNDFLINLDFNSGEKRSYTESNDLELSRMTHSDSFVSDITGRPLTVYHFVESGCSCTASDGYCDDPLLACVVCNSDQRSVVSSYCVKIQGEGHQSTPGLGNCYSPGNKALWDLLEKQLSLVCSVNFIISTFYQPFW